MFIEICLYFFPYTVFIPRIIQVEPDLVYVLPVLAAFMYSVLSLPIIPPFSILVKVFLFFSVNVLAVFVYVFAIFVVVGFPRFLVFFAVV
jgi:hypothetical protein